MLNKVISAVLLTLAISSRGTSGILSGPIAQACSAHDLLIGWLVLAAGTGHTLHRGCV